MWERVKIKIFFTKMIKKTTQCVKHNIRQYTIEEKYGINYTYTRIM